MSLCLDLLDDYAKSAHKKYKTDLDIFLHESMLEDFYREEEGTVFVSTIHKSKGREFDSVYMYLNNSSVCTDEQRRKIYVGITRSKSELYIHYNNNIFDYFDIEGVQKITDNNIYREPDEIAVQLTHHDVYLDFFKNKKGFILQLRSGMKLIPTSKGMSIKTQTEIKEVLRYSKGFSDRITELSQRGTSLHTVRYGL